MFRVRFAKIVGTADEKQWSQVHTFVPSEEKMKILGVKTFAVVLEVVEGEETEKQDLSLIGKEVIQRFHERYYGGEGAVATSQYLKESLKEVGNEFGQFVREMITGILVPANDRINLGVLYLARRGRACALLLREGKAYQLLGRHAEGEFNGEVETISGFLRDKDILLTGTGNFFELVSMKNIIEALKTEDVSEAGQSLAPYVHGTSDNSLAAAVIVKVEKEADEEERELKELRGESDGEKELQAADKGTVWLSRLGKLKTIKQKTLDKLRIRKSGFLEEDIRLKGEGQKKSKLMFSVAFTLLLLLLVSVFFGYRQRVNKEKEENFKVLTEIVEHQYTEAVALAQLNPLRARALLGEAKQAVEEGLAEEGKFSESQNRQLKQKLEEIGEALTEVSGERRLESATVFLDLNLVRDDSYGEKLGLYEGTMVILDRGSGVMLRVFLDNKASDTVGGGQLLTGAQQAAVTAGRAFVLAEAGVVEVSLAGKTSALVVEKDEEWGEIADMETFGGNLYLLDKGQGEIFRYSASAGGFGVRTRWLGEGVLPDFSKAAGMAIDGDIWILTEDGIKRFRQGAEESFLLKGLEKPLANPTAIYTSSENEMIYVLDQGNGRVVVFDKNGEYKNQYLWEGIKTVSDLVADEGGGKIFLLSGTNIYEIGIEAGE